MSREGGCIRRLGLVRGIELGALDSALPANPPVVARQRRATATATVASNGIASTSDATGGESTPGLRAGPQSLQRSVVGVARRTDGSPRSFVVRLTGQVSSIMRRRMPPGAGSGGVGPVVQRSTRSTARPWAVSAQMIARSRAITRTPHSGKQAAT